MKLKNSFVPVLIATLMTFSVAGNAKDKKPEEPTPVKLSAKVPSIAPLPETKQTQSKGGITISVTPVSYSAAVEKVSSMHKVNPSMKEMFLAHHGQRDIFVEETTTPVLVAAPDRLKYQIHISNQMPRVFRGSGTIVQFMVAGKTIAVDPSGYGELVNVIIPPRGEQDITVYGPKLSEVADPSTLGFFLFDVVTKTDAAGNVTEKQNLEWYFSYRTQFVEQDEMVPPPTRVWIPAGEFRAGEYRAGEYR